MLWKWIVLSKYLSHLYISMHTGSTLRSGPIKSLWKRSSQNERASERTSERACVRRQTNRQELRMTFQQSTKQPARTVVTQYLRSYCWFCIYNFRCAMSLALVRFSLSLSLSSLHYCLLCLCLSKWLSHSLCPSNIQCLPRTQQEKKSTCAKPKKRKTKCYRWS